METGPSTRKPINPHLATLRDSFAVMLEDFARGRGLYDARTLRILHDAAARAHDERSGALGPRGFDRAAALTASRFNLLDETELEFSLDLEDFARQIKDATEDVLSRVHLRYLALLDLRASELSEVPVGPEAVTDALRTLVETENLAIEERTLLLKSWRSPLIEDLRHFYRNLDKELESLGVAASSRGRVNNSTTAPPISGPDSQSDQKRPVWNRAGCNGRRLAHHPEQSGHAGRRQRRHPRPACPSPAARRNGE